MYPRNYKCSHSRNGDPSLFLSLEGRNGVIGEYFGLRKIGQWQGRQYKMQLKGKCDVFPYGNTQGGKNDGQKKVTWSWLLRKWSKLGDLRCPRRWEKEVRGRGKACGCLERFCSGTAHTSQKHRTGPFRGVGGARSDSGFRECQGPLSHCYTRIFAFHRLYPDHKFLADLRYDEAGSSTFMFMRSIIFFGIPDVCVQRCKYCQLEEWSFFVRSYCTRYDINLYFI